MGYLLVKAGISQGGAVYIDLEIAVLKHVTLILISLS
jgi:hypothetical protein